MSMVGPTRVASVVEPPSPNRVREFLFYELRKATMERRAAAEVPIEKHESANPRNRTTTPE